MTLSEIEEQVLLLGAQIHTPQHLFPTYGRSADGALPHIELDESGNYHFVIVERGQELERRTTPLFNDLLFWVFDAITFSMACAYELKNRNDAQDFRRILFSKQEELLGCLNPDWQVRKHTDHNLILTKHPFTDSDHTT